MSPCLSAIPYSAVGFLLCSSARTLIIFCLHLFPLPLSLHFDWLLLPAKKKKRDEEREREKEGGEDERIRSAIVLLQINFSLAAFPREKR